jgi:hypothetical protein
MSKAFGLIKSILLPVVCGIIEYHYQFWRTCHNPVRQLFGHSFHLAERLDHRNKNESTSPDCFTIFKSQQRVGNRRADAINMTTINSWTMQIEQLVNHFFNQKGNRWLNRWIAILVQWDRLLHTLLVGGHHGAHSFSADSIHLRIAVQTLVFGISFPLAFPMRKRPKGSAKLGSNQSSLSVGIFELICSSESLKKNKAGSTNSPIITQIRQIKVRMTGSQFRYRIVLNVFIRE